MSWKKHFTPVQTGDNMGGSYSPLGGGKYNGGTPGPARTNYSSYLPDVYVGSPNKLNVTASITLWIWIQKLMRHLIF